MPKRKLVAFDDETWQTLDLLAKDQMKDIQELADEAFDDLLRKHRRPVGLKQALKQSLAPPLAPVAGQPAPRRPRSRRG